MRLDPIRLSQNSNFNSIAGNKNGTDSQKIVRNNPFGTGGVDYQDKSHRRMPILSNIGKGRHEMMSSFYNANVKNRGGGGLLKLDRRSLI